MLVAFNYITDNFVSDVRRVNQRRHLHASLPSVARSAWRLVVVNNWASSSLWYVLYMPLVVTCRRTRCKQHRHRSLFPLLLMMLPNTATMFTTLCVYRHTCIDRYRAGCRQKVINTHFVLLLFLHATQVYRERNTGMHETNVSNNIKTDTHIVCIHAAHNFAFVLSSVVQLVTHVSSAWHNAKAQTPVVSICSGFL